MSAPRLGPCSPWTSAEEILTQPKCTAVDPAICATMADVASECLYVLSGRQFTGCCGPVTVRPLSRPIDADTRAIGSMVGGGYLSSWGACTSNSAPLTGGQSHYGCSNPPEVELGAYPITEITQCKIDGIVIPSTEWYVQDFRTLVRRRPTASSVPTQRYGWPTCQLIDLPDTQPGTFSVTYKYGVAPPQMGVLAANVLGAQLSLNAVGVATRLPERITSISRQGITAMIVDVMDFLKEGLTGIYECDLFLRTYNPLGMKTPPLAWSPDIGRARRMPSGTT